MRKNVGGNKLLKLCKNLSIAEKRTEVKTRPDQRKVGAKFRITIKSKNKK